MIVEMKRVTVVVLAEHQEAALHELQRLGVLHVVHVPAPPTATAAEVGEQLRRVQAAIRAVANASDTHSPAAPMEPDDILTLVQEIDELQARTDECEDLLRKLEAQIDELSIWGEFDPRRIAQLEAQGIHVALYTCAARDVPEIPDGCVKEVVRADAHQMAFAVIGRAECELPLTPLRLPEESTREMRARCARLRAEREDIAARLASNARYLGALREHAAVLEAEYARADARDQLSEHGVLKALQGYVPADAVEACRAAARAHGWGLLIEDPAPDEPIPTLIRLPRVLRPVQAVFDFIDTLPGYHERDVSAIFYLFFSLFYAMIIGDAGYGFVFLLGTLVVHLWKGKSIPKTPLYLMYVLNVATIVWGVLTGTYFGIELPENAFVQRFVVLDTTDMDVMLPLCFIIAGVQLSLAHAWNVLRVWPRLSALAEVGWIMLIWAVYFLVRLLLLNEEFPLVMAYVGGAGIVSILVFSGALKRPLELAQLPFGFINSFADVISYIRLFAVSYAALALAQAFNEIAANIGMNTVLAGFVAALILVLGHGLNMALSALSVLVHGLRLNMLEFSSHLGQEWTGVRYTPLRGRTGK
jgi:V/A-type H+-transporting ATPase subunit I